MSCLQMRSPASAGDVADVMAEPELEIAVLLKALVHQLGDNGLCLRPGGRADERLIGAPAVRFRRHAGACVDELLGEFESPLLEAGNAAGKIIDEGVEVSVGDRAVHPSDRK